VSSLYIPTVDIMASEMQNVNPTILSAADLPTRQRTKSAEQSGKKNPYGETIYSSDLLRPLAKDPFAIDAYSSSEPDSDADDEDLLEEPIDEQEIFGLFSRHPRLVRFSSSSFLTRFADLISTISDPEHPISLGSLAVVSLPDIAITPSLPNNPTSPLRTVTVLITPTITHCSLATVIGLGVRVRLEQSLPPRFRVDVRIKEGTHSTADEVNKQLADKERVAAALENGTLMGVIGKMLETCQ
jgi:metal-sulfur cluster biosynthetic enzyme